MKPLILWVLCWTSVVVHAQPQMSEPEFQIIFPDKAAVVDDQYIDHNRALVIKNVDGFYSTEVLDVADITGIPIPDNTAVTGFTSINNGGPSGTVTVSYLFSLSTAAGDYLRDDVIECNSDGCSLYATFDKNATISALDYVNRGNDLLVSFDTGFDVNGTYINPVNMYRSDDFSLFFGDFNDGFGDNNSITAFDSSEFNYSASPSRMYESVIGLVKPSELFNSSSSIANVITEELASKITGIEAYFSVDSGWLEFQQTTINVSESAGLVSFNLIRAGGFEGSTSAVVRVVDGTAVDGVDYDGVFNQYYWIDGGLNNYEINLNVIDNNWVDGTRTFTVELQEANNDFRFSLINPNKNVITINILDDDAGDLIFADGFE